MYKVYTDAAYNPQTKEAAIAFNVVKEGVQYQQTKYYSKVFDNHEAEFRAVLFSLQYLHKQNATQEMIMLHSDSRIVIQSLDKRYVKEERYNDYLQQILPLVDACKLLYWKWIPDKENKFTDQIARQALRRKGGNCDD